MLNVCSYMPRLLLVHCEQIVVIQSRTRFRRKRLLSITSKFSNFFRIISVTFSSFSELFIISSFSELLFNFFSFNYFVFPSEFLFNASPSAGGQVSIGAKQCYFPNSSFLLACKFNSNMSTDLITNGQRRFPPQRLHREW